jgi:hypothetical protein
MSNQSRVRTKKTRVPGQNYIGVQAYEDEDRKEAMKQSLAAMDSDEP